MKRPLNEGSTIPGVGVGLKIVVEFGGKAFTRHYAICYRDGEHGIVGKATLRVEQREVRALDWRPLVHRPDHIPGNRADHGSHNPTLSNPDQDWSNSLTRK